MDLRMELGERSYDIRILRGGLAQAHRFFNLDRRVMAVTEPGVPEAYAKSLLAQCEKGFLHVAKGGEDGKNLSEVERLLRALKDADFTRGDCVVAVGGGVIGDLSGFAAACYMRGIDFYNIPTTLLSQIDSSIGGKTGVNFDGVKNLIGTFHQPRGVLIDPALLESLPRRQLANGMAEAIKMAMNFDAALVCEMEQGDPYDMIDTVIERSLRIKKQVVEKDEKESGLRRVLNFGHTIGHGIEGLGQDRYHGECVALGMLPMCTDAQERARLRALLEKVGLPTEFEGDADRVIALAMHDKKRIKDGVMTVQVDKIGSFVFREMSREAMRSAMKETFGI